MALEARPDVVLVRQRIAEPARYYAELQTIVTRTGLLLCEERRHLWHELEHHDRGDRRCHNGHGVEQSVERAAVYRAMPIITMEWAIPRADDIAELADILKLPEDWVRYRWRIAPPDEKRWLQRVFERS